MEHKGCSLIKRILFIALLMSFPEFVAAQTQQYFPIGIWCTQLPVNAQGQITQVEQDRIRDLGVTYLIACPNQEHATMDFCDQEIAAGRTLRRDIENDPGDPNNSLFSDWGRFADDFISPNPQVRQDWIDGVEDILTKINTGWAFRDGFADIIIISGESGAEDPDHWPGLLNHNLSFKL